MPEEIEPSTERQRAPRNTTNWIGLIRTPDGAETPCTVKDVSKTGAKIGVPAHIELPNDFMLKIIGMDYVCSVNLAWRAGSLAGVRILQLAKLPPKPLTTQHQAEAADRAPHQSLGTRRGLRRG